MGVLSVIEPKTVWKYFEEISAIPRGSGNEKEICSYFEEFAIKNSLWYKRDEYNNILIRKEASKGYENSDGVILQGHMDMVCEKTALSNHDFNKDPIKIKLNDDFITADGTTLGADNGIACAIALAVLEDNSLEHPAIEVLLTSDEEVDMGGAKNFDCSLIKGKRLINIDSEEEGEIITGCAGGMRAELKVPVKRMAAPPNAVYCQISISGLKGGHSGSDIHLNRASAIKLAGRLMNELFNSGLCGLCEVTGGNKDNAIPRETKIIVWCAEKDIKEINEIVLKCEEMFSKEYSPAENGITITMDKIDIRPETVLSADTFGVIKDVINLIPFGVVFMSGKINGLVESSNNIGVIRTYKDYVSIISAPRSSVETRRDLIESKFVSISRLTGSALEIRGKYPAWEYREISPLRDIMVETYKDMFGKEMCVNAIHAGLECGILSKGMPQVDMVSIGPEMYDVHTTEERISVSSVERTYKYIIEVLKRLK